MKDGIEVGPSLFHVTQYLRTTYMIGKSADQAAMSFPSIVQGLLAPPPSHLQLSFPTCSARASSGAQFLRRRGCTALVLQAVKLCRSCQRLRRPSSTLRGGPMANSSASAVTSSLSYEKRQKPIVIEPKGEHLVTMVWLHGLGDTGDGWADTLEALPLKHVKWILPTAPIRPVTVNGGMPCTAWFDVGSLSSETLDDVEGLDQSAAWVASLLLENSISSDGKPVKLAVGGFSMGAATSIYTATRSAVGKYGNGKPFPVSLSAVVGLSGWLPRAKVLAVEVPENPENLQRAASIPLFLAHGTADWIVSYKFGEQSKAALQAAGFKNVIFKPYQGLQHGASEEELADVLEWLKNTLVLD